MSGTVLGLVCKDAGNLCQSPAAQAPFIPPTTRWHQAGLSSLCLMRHWSDGKQTPDAVEKHDDQGFRPKKSSTKLVVFSTPWATIGNHRLRPEARYNAPYRMPHRILSTTPVMPR